MICILLRPHLLLPLYRSSPTVVFSILFLQHRCTSRFLPLLPLVEVFFLNFFPAWVTNVTQVLTPMSHHHRDPVLTKFPPSFPIISSAFHSTFNTISLSISVSWSYKNVSWRKEKNAVNTQSIVIWFMNK